MKRLTLHRLASALLCLTLALSLTACGGKRNRPRQRETAA